MDGRHDLTFTVADHRPQFSCQTTTAVATATVRKPAAAAATATVRRPAAAATAWCHGTPIAAHVPVGHLPRVGRLRLSGRYWRSRRS